MFANRVARGFDGLRRFFESMRAAAQVSNAMRWNRQPARADLELLGLVDIFGMPRR